MKRAIVALVVSTVLAVSGGVVSAGPAHAGRNLPPTHLGPGDANVSNVGGKAVIRNSKFGPVYISGKHDNHLRIKYVEHRQLIRFRDTRTRRVKSMPNRCSQEQVKTGISVICKIPKRFQEPGKKMFIQVWPRLGDDYVDGRGLPPKFRMWVLADAGNDVMHGGRGWDFFNGAKGNDRAWGNNGRDWLRGGPGADRLRGGKCRDRIAQG